MSLVYSYLCKMRDEIIIPVQKDEDLIAAAKRSEKYSQKRDIQAMEFNEAIAHRLAKEKEKEQQESNQSEI